VSGGDIPPEPLEHLLDGVDALVCGLDGGGRILHSNRWCEKVTGLHRRELRGQRWLEIFAHAERHPRIHELWAQVSAGVSTPPFESLCRNERRIRWRFSHWKLSHHEEDGLCAFGVDVTDDRAELARAREAERTVSVAQLASGLAHEIRNPLNSAKLQLDVAERQIASSRPERAGDSVKRASVEILRANALLSDFLAFARPPKVDFAPIDLRRVAIDAKDRAVSKRAPGCDVDLQLGPAPIVDGDGELVGAAIEHLVTNALDAVATSPGAGRVVLRLLVERNAACVEVEDDGPGLPSPETPVFDAFFTTKPSSTGLGLAVVQRVAFDHGGSISYSRRNDRTVFTLRLPFVFGASATFPG
jgi:PAS domain S-box-containing protein